MNLNPEYQILLFYKYVHIDNPAEVMEWQQRLCEKYDFKGRLIVAKEGINFTFEGKTADTESYIKELETDSRFKDIHFKRSVGTGNAFRKLSVKVRPEIVSLHLGTCDIDPNVMTGIHLSPDDLHLWIKEKREFYIVDMRNAYEHKVGHFAGSICPPMDNFRDLQKVVKSLAHLKNKTVVTVCTGGVRCEKASGYLLSQGFSDVYQLDGGIVSYMEKYPNEDFLGKLYVFDKRIAMGFYTDDPKHVIVGKCQLCDLRSENYVNCSNMACHQHLLVCEKCVKDNNEYVTCPKGCTLNRSGRPVKSNFFGRLFSFFK